MSNPEQILQKMIADYGPELVNQPSRVKGLLMDLCTRHKGAVRLLATVAENGMAKSLIRDGGKNLSVLIPQLADQLHEDYCFDQQLSRWALESWAEALFHISQEEQDFAEAEERLRLTAEQGDAERKFNLGYMYYHGEGVPQDHAEAVKWLRLAAEHGYAKAQFHLGARYYTGEGVPQDHAEAVKWFRLAAEQGYAEAQGEVGAGYYIGEGVPQDHAEAVKWFRLAAEQGHAKGQYMLGHMYHVGEGVPQDHAEAVKWFRLAAEQGYAEAQFMLGGRRSPEARQRLDTLREERQLRERETKRSWTESVTGMEFVWVPGGTFEMGDMGEVFSDGNDEEKPVHSVTLKGFWLSRYPVTQSQWQKVMGYNPSFFREGGDYPVESVSWNQVQEFIKALNAKGSAKFRLPSEAQWEYACRSGGKAEKYSGGSNVGRVAWYGGNSQDSTHPVGRKDPNSLGLHDMSGNVWEWVEDRWHGSYNGAPTDGSAWVSGDVSFRGYRGGGWSDEPRLVRCASRNGDSPDFRDSDLGFRLLRTN